MLKVCEGESWVHHHAYCLKMDSRFSQPTVILKGFFCDQYNFPSIAKKDRRNRIDWFTDWIPFAPLEIVWLLARGCLHIIIFSTATVHTTVFKQVAKMCSTFCRKLYAYC